MKTWIVNSFYGRLQLKTLDNQSMYSIHKDGVELAVFFFLTVALLLKMLTEQDNFSQKELKIYQKARY